jgi:hypothetical protein
MNCNMTGPEYKIYGYKGKQVRDNIHSGDVARGDGDGGFGGFSSAGDLDGRD